MGLACSCLVGGVFAVGFFCYLLVCTSNWIKKWKKEKGGRGEHLKTFFFSKVKRKLLFIY